MTSSKGDDTCHFGHVLDIWDGGENSSVQRKIRNGRIRGLDELEDEEEMSLFDVLSRWKYLKFRSKDQGSAYTGMWVAVDELTTNKDYEVNKIEESIHISPQSQMHQQFMERKQQAEQNITQTMKGYQDLIKQKHMLQHDIRKLRSRVEAINSHDETMLKGDFIELVDGANAGSQQGGEAAMKTLVERNIYPTIVSDFQEMESVEDLESADERAERYDDKDEEDLEDGVLADLPANEKAVLKKKYKMYEQWKDLYGSEVERKLNDLKGQMKNIQRSISETEEWLEPYVKDAATINKMGGNQDEANSHLNVRGNSTMKRSMEFVVHKPMKLEEGEMHYTDEEPTHYRAMIIKTTHVNIAGWSQPQSPADGPSAGIVTWHPFFCCKHVFEEFVKPKINEYDNMVQDLMDDYTGEFETEEGEELKQSRQEKEMSVRDLREEVDKKTDEKVPLKLSSNIRKVEDGLEQPESAIKKEHLEKIDEILDTEFHPKNKDSSDPDEEMYTGITRDLKEFLGMTDDYKIPDNLDPLGDFTNDLRFEYYWGLKMDFGMYTMK